MIKDDIIRKQLSRGLEMPEKRASGKRQNRIVPQSSGLETAQETFNGLNFQLFTSTDLMRFLERRLYVPPTVRKTRNIVLDNALR
jgi:hypothetical protein